MVSPRIRLERQAIDTVGRKDRENTAKPSVSLTMFDRFHRCCCLFFFGFFQLDWVDCGRCLR